MEEGSGKGKAGAGYWLKFSGIVVAVVIAAIVLVFLITKVSNWDEERTIAETFKVMDVSEYKLNADTTALFKTKKFIIKTTDGEVDIYDFEVEMQIVGGESNRIHRYQRYNKKSQKVVETQLVFEMAQGEYEKFVWDYVETYGVTPPKYQGHWRMNE